jgi:hypothetical protein
MKTSIVPPHDQHRDVDELGRLLAQDVGRSPLALRIEEQLDQAVGVAGTWPRALFSKRAWPIS